MSKPNFGPAKFNRFPNDCSVPLIGSLTPRTQLVCQHLSTLYVYFSEEHTAAVARAIVDIVAAVGDTYNRPEATSVSNRTGTWATVTATLLTDAAFVELVGIVTAVVACVAVSLASTVERIMGQTQAAGGAKRKKSGKGQVGDGGSVGRAGGLVADEKVCGRTKVSCRFVPQRCY
jgi:hypothetical protein